MTYVDGFVIPVPKKNLAKYRKMAALGCKVWMKHGALQYFETVGDDLDVPCGIPFPKGIQVKKGEAIIFAFIVYKSKAHRNQVVAAVMSDPDMSSMGTKMPFDMNRMMTGGFKTLVSS